MTPTMTATLTADITYQTDNPHPQTLTASVTPDELDALRELTTNPTPGLHLLIPARLTPHGPSHTRVLDAARILAITPHCDNTSVGILIHNPETGTWLMFDRNTPPPGTAPAAGHIDTHGTPEQGAAAEAAEETGLTVGPLTLVTGGWRPNVCRRPAGPAGIGHHWSVYTASATGQLSPSARETRNARWLTATQITDLVTRTVAYAHGSADTPGIEPVWVLWLVHAGLAQVSGADLDVIEAAASRSPHH